MAGIPESVHSKIQLISQLVKEHPLYTAGVTLMYGAVLHTMAIAIPANVEANERMTSQRFTGGPEVARQVDLRRAEILGEIYKKRFQGEINAEVGALGIGGALLLAEVGLSLARRGRRRFNGPVLNGG